MQREKAIRYSFMEALQNLTVDGIAIPVYDSKDESNEQVYVILSTQFSQRTGNLSILQWKCTMDIEIYHNQQNSATNDIVDNIAEAIEAIIEPNPVPVNFSLPPQTGWIFADVYCSTTSNIKMANYKNESGVTVNKTLQFSLTVIKTI